MLRPHLACLIACACLASAADLHSPLIESCALAEAQPEVPSAMLRLGTRGTGAVRVLVRPRFPGAPELTAAAAGELRLRLSGVRAPVRVEARAVAGPAAAWTPASATWSWQELSRVRHVRTGAWEHRPWPGGPGAAAVLAGAVVGTVAVERDGEAVLGLGDPTLLAALAAPGSGGLLLSADGDADLAILGFVLRGIATARPVTTFTTEVPAGCDRLSVRIVDAEGRGVRELLHAVPAPPGRHEVAWDGRDDTGAAAAPGAYRWLATAHAGLRAEYLLTLGLSVDHHDLWPGNHIGVSGLAVDAARDRVYLGSGCSEAHGFVLAMQADGNRVWTNPEFWFDAWKGPDAMACDGDRLFFAQLDGQVFRLDARDGRRQGNAWKLMPEGKAKRPGDPERGWKAMKDGRMHGGNVAYLDLATGGGRLALSFELHDLVRFVDPGSGKVLREVALPAPRGIAFAADGRLLAISDGRIVALGDGGPAELVPARALVEPWRLAVDPADGSLLVAEGGASQQIVRFAADGRELRRYGRRGGRPEQGAYDASGFLGITALAAGADGSFWVAEAYTAPRRIARFDRDGRLLREWYGPQMYAARCFPDPADQRTVWLDAYWGELIEAEVDYAARTWRVKGTWRYGDGYNHEDGMWFVRHHQGRTYLCDESRPYVLLVDREQRRLVPVAEAGTAYYPGGNAGWRIPDGFRPVAGQWDEAAARQRDPKDERSHRPWSFWWHDADGDGRREAEEAVWDKLLLAWPRTSYVDDQLVYHTRLGLSWKEQGAWRGKELAQGHGTLLPAWSGTVPRYALDAATWLPADAQSAAQCVWLDREGARWACDRQRVTRWLPDGRRAWSVGRPTGAARPGPGETKAIHRFIGTAHGTGAVAEIHHSDSGVWDRDGLWLGRLLEQPDLARVGARAYELCGENFGGVLVEETGRPGCALYFGGTANAVAVYRISGFDRLRSSSGPVQLQAP